MATLHTRSAARLMMAPAVLLLFAWMIVPLAMTLYFSFLRYNLLMPGTEEWIGFLNYSYFLTDPAFQDALLNTLLLVGGVLVISVGGGLLLALLLDQPFFGQGIVRLMVIAPFFVMPTVSALILLTALQSLDEEQKEAAEMDGAGFFSRFAYITLPHLSRAITVVILIETIFLLSVFAEILVTTSGGPGTESTNIAYLIYAQALLQYDVGGASAGGIIAVILANIVAFFLIRLIGKSLDA